MDEVKRDSYTIHIHVGLSITYLIGVKISFVTGKSAKKRGRAIGL
jgi:hypothetical protein